MYQVELERTTSWTARWKWTVILPNGFMVSDYSITKAGALWMIKRGIKEHKQAMKYKQHVEKWVEI